MKRNIVISGLVIGFGLVCTGCGGLQNPTIEENKNTEYKSDVYEDTNVDDGELVIV